MHKSSINKSIIILLVFAITIITPANIFASKGTLAVESKVLNNYDILKYEDVQSYIKNSIDSETVEILDETVTYYYGDYYTIVKDNSGYSKINFKGNGKIFVNDKEVESRVAHEDIYPDEINLSSSISPTSTWVEYETTNREYDVIGLAPGVIGGIIGGAIGHKIGSVLGQVFSIVGGAVVGTIAGGFFPEYYISIESIKSYKLPITTSRPITKTDRYVYHGTKYNRYKHSWFKF